MRRLAVLAVLAMAMLPVGAQANPSNDAEACKPDVFRLCSQAIPWRDRIIACLHEKKRQLSPACYQVFNRKPAKLAKPAPSDRQPTAAQYEPGTWR